MESNAHNYIKIKSDARNIHRLMIVGTFAFEGVICGGWTLCRFCVCTLRSVVCCFRSRSENLYLSPLTVLLIFFIQNILANLEFKN